ncbi:MAG: hypothetical protein U9Q80_10555 [Bacillota bacterium]|nr:hypothetical protein [Bacillota bacterium]
MCRYIIDADIIIKLGNYEHENYLDSIISKISENLYIHEYVYMHEIRECGKAKNRLDDLVRAGKIRVMSENDLITEEEKASYDIVYSGLVNDFGIDKADTRGKNKGEAMSIAMAAAKQYKYLISDDKDAKIYAKRRADVETLNMNGIIVMLKNNQKYFNISRKDAKSLYLYPYNPNVARNLEEKIKFTKALDRMKKRFDNELWVVDD